MPKVIVGMSGGVDSAVSAYLLKKEGYEVTGLTLRTWDADENAYSRCCEIDDARETAEMLGIRYYVQNCVGEFKEHVTKPFIDDYIHGITPNPCIVCNRYVKWERMIRALNELGADYIATGHYASVLKLDNGRYSVRKARHLKKDQTYMLYALTQEQLSKTLMPLGDYSKDEVRLMAKEAGIAVADKKDSQEICFVTDGDYAKYIEENAEGRIPPEGNFVDEEGNILGRHKGIIHYTVGQRRGLNLPLGYHAYIKRICPDTNEIVLCREESVYTGKIICRDVNFLSIPPMKVGEKLRCNVKIRYQHPGQEGEITLLEENMVGVAFDDPVKASTPGQSAVFYDNDGFVVGGGVIYKA